jgi:O-antigen ligase
MLAPINRVSSLLLFATVAAAPFPFGSTDHSTIAFWCVVLGLGVIGVSLHGFRREHIPLLGLAVILILAYGLVLHEQLSERPWFATPHPLWRETAETLGISIPPSVSIARNQPFFAVGAPLANMLAVICSFIVCTDRDRAYQLFRVIGWSGAAYAVFGIAAFLIDPTHVLWREKIAYRDVLTSTFINRNTAAVYFGSCAVVWLLFLARDIRRRLPEGPILWLSVPRFLLAKTPRSVIISFSILLVCLAAMLMTNSRAGIVFSLMMLIVAFAIFFYRDLPRRGGVAATIVIGGLIALVFLQVFGGNVSGRFNMQGLSDEGRLDVYNSALKMIADRPWFGSGLGTFVWNFPAYRSANISIWGIWDRAHSTPLELATDLGLPLAGLIVLVWLIVIAVLIRGVRIRRRDLILPIGAMTVAILALAHSMIDFSLQIPGYSVIVFALVGAGLAQSFPSTHSNNNRDKQLKDMTLPQLD